ncbi:hypothetical protein DPMN_081638 [Dreissena polymorpha]|uniref:Uncharacterized protein n=1 Tax=Dreissena polymorpha TaxID=45954 RepID=A0A9D3Y5E3_DREPO|nr:hypothetical protein DPMN_081638 [Dreissena polymorpha]
MANDMLYEDSTLMKCCCESSKISTETPTAKTFFMESRDISTGHQLAYFMDICSLSLPTS